MKKKTIKYFLLFIVTLLVTNINSFNDIYFDSYFSSYLNSNPSDNKENCYSSTNFLFNQTIQNYVDVERHKINGLDIEIEEDELFTNKKVNDSDILFHRFFLSSIEKCPLSLLNKELVFSLNSYIFSTKKLFIIFEVFRI
ncbi:conserved hypothetical protein [Flavobacterium sp. 9AF]|uniref:hypothetical protein n=1 Tax=Flavobacterium sp. 9AF TaxID=2653142 RepID=UPI0012F28D41|nr:hypothetical protein [Flavobacterium sp. 9AF]VXB74987.1 conserved hypothetical protein [Flavobacterium sp. 9AF]